MTTEQLIAIINALKQQRNGAADALVEQIGEYAKLQAEWMAKWSDREAVSARLTELEKINDQKDQGLK